MWGSDLPILPFLWIWPGMIPILHSPGCKQTTYFGTSVICNSIMNVHVVARDPHPNDSWTVWSYNPRLILSKQLMFHFNHIVLWDPLRDDNCKWYLKNLVCYLSLFCQSISFCLILSFSFFISTNLHIFRRNISNLCINGLYDSLCCSLWWYVNYWCVCSRLFSGLEIK